MQEKQMEEERTRNGEATRGHEEIMHIMVQQHQQMQHMQEQAQQQMVNLQLMISQQSQMLLGIFKKIYKVCITKFDTVLRFTLLHISALMLHVFK